MLEFVLDLSLDELAKVRNDILQVLTFGFVELGFPLR